MIPIRDTVPCYCTPYITWALITICITIFVALQLMPDQLHHQVIYLYGMVPVRYSDPLWASSFGLPFDSYLSFLSNLFLHGGWLHLIINMWFLWIFADNIEDRMGHFRFIVFYLICGVIATIVQWYDNPSLAIPVVGASGAIAGVLGAYFFLYPYAKIVLWFPVFLLPIVFDVPAIAFLGAWLIIQLHQATTAVMFEGVTANVAWWAHVGGFLAGAGLYRFFITQNQSE